MFSVNLSSIFLLFGFDFRRRDKFIDQKSVSQCLEIEIDSNITLFRYRIHKKL